MRSSALKFALMVAAVAGGGAVARGAAVPVTTHIVAGSGADPGTSFDTAGTRAAAAQVAAAQREIDRAISDLRRAFEQSQELRDAQSAARTSSANYYDACRLALAPLRQTRAYRVAAENVQQLERRLAAAVQDDRARRRERSEIATALFTARRAVTAMETKVLAEDQDVTAARYAMIDAGGKVTVLRREFVRSIQIDPQFLQARARLESARAQLRRAR